MPRTHRPNVREAAGALLGEVGQAVPARQRITFQPLAPAQDPGNAAAVDGGSTVALDLGAGGIVGVCAGFTLRTSPDRYEDKITYDEAHEVVRRTAEARWLRLARLYDGTGPIATPATKGLQWIRGWCDAERSLVEFDAARQALQRLDAGGLLLLDGSLDPDVPHFAFVDRLVDQAHQRGVTVAAVTKDTTLSFDGTLPFTLQLEEAARAARASPHFWCDVTQAFPPAGRFSTYGARWDARAPVYRVDVAAPDAAPGAQTLARLQGLCNDVVYSGYPYPLARIHQAVHYSEDDALDLRRQLESEVAERRGSAFSLRLFGRGRDVLALGE